MSGIPLVSVHELARWIFHKEKVAVLDIRSYREFHTSHIHDALNVGGNRVLKRKLLSNSAVLGSFISAVVGVSQDELLRFEKIILYDQYSEDGAPVTSDDFANFFITQTIELFPNVALLHGGFLGFRAAYPQLCWQHPDKLPDEEFVGVKGDSGLESLLDDCLTSMAGPRSPSALSYIGSRSNASTRQPSSCSSCGSSSSHQSNDSGLGLGSSVSKEIAADISRISVSRVTSAPITRPCTVTASLSLDDMTSTRRPSRLRPATLSLCSSSSTTTTQNFNICSNTTSTSTLHLRVPLSLRPGPPIRSRTYDTTSRSSTFASSYQQLLSSSSSSSHAPRDSLSPHCHTTWFPTTPPPPRPLSTVSAALSAEAFESPRPTSVLPHLLLGCQADAMSAAVCEEFGITHIINVSADGEVSPHVSREKFLRIPIHDNNRSDIVPFFEMAFAFLDDAKASNGRVLVHCFAGISRSPTLAIGYLMKTQQMTFDEAYIQVKAIRPKISPNFNFIGQLMAFQKELQLSESHAPRETSLSPPRKTAGGSPPPPSLSHPTRPHALRLPASSSIQHPPTLLDAPHSHPPTFLITPSTVYVESSVPSPQPQPKLVAVASRNVPSSKSVSSLSSMASTPLNSLSLSNTDPLPRSTNSTSTATAKASTTITTNSIPSRPASLLVRRPTQKAEYVVGSVSVSTAVSKKRDRPHHLSLYPPTPPSDQSSTSSAVPSIGGGVGGDAHSSTTVVVGRRKRSRFGGPALLPSPSTAIASLDLSSPSDEWRLLRAANDPPPPPPSPRPRRLRRFMHHEDNDSPNRRFSLSVFPEEHHSQQPQYQTQRFSVFEPPSSDIDSDVDMMVMSASNPTIIQSPASRWPSGSHESSCRHQQATAESSCHSSLSSSSNGQHTTPSFPIS